MIRLRYWIESARCVPVLGLVVGVLFVVVFLVTALDLHEECPIELIAVGCLALVVSASWLGRKAARAAGSRRKSWLRGAIVGRAPPIVSFGPIVGSFVPGASPALR